MTEMTIAAFIAGIGIGIGLHRLLMAIVLEDSPDTPCAYCMWLRRKTELNDKFTKPSYKR